jgi:hypothetical protein
MLSRLIQLQKKVIQMTEFLSSHGNQIKEVYFSTQGPSLQYCGTVFDDTELHTAAAHKLLRWLSIKRLLAPKVIDEDYVMELEEKRGSIRVYGQGEGDDWSDYIQAASPNPSNILPPYKDGWLNTDAETARRLCQSYLQHIHILHPFLDEAFIERKLNDFINLYSLPKNAP